MKSTLPVVWIINPGSTSTKTAIASEQKILVAETIRHKAEQLNAFPAVIEQESLRYEIVATFFLTHHQPDSHLVAVVGRGGPIRPIPGGTYKINERMLEDCRSCRYGEHVSILGAPLAHRIAAQHQVPAFVVDPPSVDELSEAARISGVPGVTRISRFHALNIRCVARKAAHQLSKPFNQCSLVVAHLGGGISVAAINQGRVFEVNNALLGDGPFSPDRAGNVPIHGLLDIACAPGASRRDLERLFTKQSGLMGYIGTNDLFEVERRIADGDREALFYLEVMAYSIVKEIGAKSAALGSKPDAIILTGGMARSDVLVPMITSKIEFLAPILLFPGEMELEALASGAFRVLNGEEQALDY